jgi:hypothetical protein
MPNCFFRNRVFLFWLSPSPGLKNLDDRIITPGNKNFYGPEGLAQVSSQLLAALDSMMIRMKIRPIENY